MTEPMASSDPSRPKRKPGKSGGRPLFNFRLGPSYAERLDQLAAERDVPRSVLFREALERAFSDPAPSRLAAQPRQKRQYPGARTLNFRLGPSYAERLDQLAAERGVARSVLFREALERLLVESATGGPAREGAPAKAS